MEDFGKILGESMNGIVTVFKPGEKVTGTVCAIDDKTVYLDVHSTSEGLIHREELVDANGELPVKVGDQLEAFYMDSENGGLNFSVKMTSSQANSQLDEAFANGIPVEGKVTGERKGGLTVKIAGDEAFCPFSQISLNRAEASDFIGNTYLFHIQELNGRNFVVSRRKMLEQEKQEKLASLKEELKVGDIVHGKVVNIKDFGVFVELGGTQGFIPVSELSWGRVKAEDVVSIGDEVTVAVINLDWEKERITLSLRSTSSPWSDIAAKYPSGTNCKATIRRIEPFGAFAELEPGVDGLIHISKLGAGRRINSPGEVVSVGEEIDVVVESVDMDKHRISLAKAMFGGKAPEASANTVTYSVSEQDLKPGATVEGTVDAIKAFGAFIKLTAKKSGLLHISEAGFGQHVANPEKSLSEKFPVGSKLKVTIKSIESGKISLTLKGGESNKQDSGNFSDSSGGDLGNLGSLFEGL
ncbi:MAG: S1 RNA-binding domain-containing protein [Victivallales bacterium]|nr:S1 RNA-binding domain-containing protein [Victivallales bacterium]